MHRDHSTRHVQSPSPLAHACAPGWRQTSRRSSGLPESSTSSCGCWASALRAEGQRGSLRVYGELQHTSWKVAHGGRHRRRSIVAGSSTAVRTSRLFYSVALLHEQPEKQQRTHKPESHRPIQEASTSVHACSGPLPHIACSALSQQHWRAGPPTARGVCPRHAWLRSSKSSQGYQTCVRGL